MARVKQQIDCELISLGHNYLSVTTVAWTKIKTMLPARIAAPPSECYMMTPTFCLCHFLFLLSSRSLGVSSLCNHPQKTAVVVLFSRVPAVFIEGHIKERKLRRPATTVVTDQALRKEKYITSSLSPSFCGTAFSSCHLVRF